MALLDKVTPVATEEGCVISSGTSLSNAVPIIGLKLFGIVMPSGWDAANISFQASADYGVTWRDVYDGNVSTGGSEYVISAAASRYIVLDPTAFCTITMIKIRSGTSGTPVNQTADRALQLILRRY